MKPLKILYDDYLQKYKWVCPECEGGNLVVETIVELIPTGLVFVCNHCRGYIKSFDMLKAICEYKRRNEETQDWAWNTLP